MSVRSYPFKGEATGYNAQGFPTSDRDYNDEDLVRYVGNLKYDGVTNEGSNPMLVTSSGSLNIRINLGMILIQGRFGEIYDSAETLTLAKGDSNPRIDLISMRLDTKTARAIKPVVIKGTPAQNPVAPALTRANGVYDMVLAKVSVAASASSITQSNITDTRADKDLCGMRNWKIDDRGAPDGVAPLVNGKVPEEYLPKSVGFNPFAGLKFVPVSGLSTTFDTRDTPFVYDDKIISINQVYYLTQKTVFNHANIPAQTFGRGYGWGVRVTSTIIETYWATISNWTTTGTFTVTIYRCYVTGNVSTVETHSTHNVTNTAFSKSGNSVFNSGRSNFCCMCANDNNKLLVMLCAESSQYVPTYNAYLYDVSTKTFTRSAIHDIPNSSPQFLYRILWANSTTGTDMCYYGSTNDNGFQVYPRTGWAADFGGSTGSSTSQLVFTPYYYNMKDNKIIATKTTYSTTATRGAHTADLVMADFSTKTLISLGRYVLMNPAQRFSRNNTYVYESESQTMNKIIIENAQI